MRADSRVERRVDETAVLWADMKGDVMADSTAALSVFQTDSSAAADWASTRADLKEDAWADSKAVCWDRMTVY